MRNVLNYQNLDYKLVFKTRPSSISWAALALLIPSGIIALWGFPLWFGGHSAWISPIFLFSWIIISGGHFVLEIARKRHRLIAESGIQNLTATYLIVIFVSFLVVVVLSCVAVPRLASTALDVTAVTSSNIARHDAFTLYDDLLEFANRNGGRFPDRDEIVNHEVAVAPNGIVEIRVGATTFRYYGSGINVGASPNQTIFQSRETFLGKWIIVAKTSGEVSLENVNGTGPIPPR